MPKTLPILLVTTGISLTLAAGSALAQERDTARGSQDGTHMQYKAKHHGGHPGKRHGMHRGGGRMGAQLMEAYDTDGDGRLTQDELDAARAAQLQEFDANGDGTLDLSEYEQLWLDAMRERMVDRFQQHDDDGDGQVTVEEFAEDFENLIERADQNGDGALSRDDMRRMPRAAADTQEDG